MTKLKPLPAFYRAILRPRISLMSILFLVMLIAAVLNHRMWDTWALAIGLLMVVHMDQRDLAKIDISSENRVDELMSLQSEVAKLRSQLEIVGAQNVQLRQEMSGRKQEVQVGSV